jgi:glycosyltransferase involved in cell wall biosynthesis
VGTWVVVPALNEASNLRIVVPEIAKNLLAVDSDGQVLVMDDGSQDDTQAVIAELQQSLPCLHVDGWRRNRGKAAALRRGFQIALDADADAIVMMDADGQDDPSELPRVLAALESGSDLATGARLERNDRLVKRSTSKMYNWGTAKLSGTPGRDFNSGFKAMKPETAAAISPMLYGELYRYITVIAHWLGYEVTEVPVQHHARLHGKTKYGLNRFWRGLLDLLTVRFLMSYEHRPSHLFGGLGIISILAGLVMLAYLLVQRLMGETIGDRPMLIVAVLFVVVGAQALLFGLLAELIVYVRQRGNGTH